MTSASTNETVRTSVTNLDRVLRLVEQTGVRSTALTTNFGPSTRFVKSGWNVAPVFKGPGGHKYTLLCVEGLTIPDTASSVISESKDENKANHPDFPTQEGDVLGRQAVANSRGAVEGTR